MFSSSTAAPLRPSSNGSAIADTATSIADEAAGKAQRALHESRVATDDALDALSGGIDKLSERAPDAIARIASQVEDLARRSLERARDTSAQVRVRVNEASDATVSRIKDEPMKSVLIAAAIGAGLTALVGLAASRRRRA